VSLTQWGINLRKAFLAQFLFPNDISQGEGASYERHAYLFLDMIAGLKYEYQFRFLKELLSKTTGAVGISFRRPQSPPSLHRTAAGPQNSTPDSPRRESLLQRRSSLPLLEPPISGLGAFYVQCRVWIAVF